MSNTVVDLFGRLPKRRRSRLGFTLLELLLVIAIIFVLVSILLPVISKARDSAKRAQCINNLQMISKAVLNYVSDNEGALPFAASSNSNMPGPPGPHIEDWIYWSSTKSTQDPMKNWIDLIGSGGVGKYLGCDDHSATGMSILRCPSDARLNNSIAGSFPPYSMPDPNGQAVTYPFSYVLNAMMSSGNADPRAVTVGGQSALARMLARVKDPSTKILVYEEDPRLIHDGNGVLMPSLNGGNTDFISLRHEAMEIVSANGANDPNHYNNSDPINAKVVNNGTPPGFDPTWLTRVGVKSGNAAFCDGHAETVTRAVAHSKQSWAPDPALFPTYP